METKGIFKLNDRALMAAVLFLLASFFGTLFGATKVTSLAFTVSLAAVAGFYAYRCVCKRSINWYFLITVLLAFLSLLLGGISSSFEYFKPAIIFLCALACIELAPDDGISDNAKKLAVVSVMAASLVLIVYFHFFGLKDQLYGSTDLVDMNFQNPNEAALWIMCFIVTSVLGIGLFSNMYAKIAVGAVAVLLIPLLLATKSRNAMIACIFFVICYAVISFFKIRKVPKWTVAVAVISPLIVFAVYMMILNLLPEALDTVMGDDPSKILGSRAEMWAEVLEGFNSCFLFGNYGEFSDRQMHNSFATLFCQYGLPLLCAASCLMVSIANRMQRRISIYATLALCTLFVSGCFETSLFGGVAGLYLMFFILPSCCKSRGCKE